MSLAAKELHLPFALAVNGDPGGADTVTFTLEEQLSHLPLLFPTVLLSVRTGGGTVNATVERVDDYGTHAEPYHSGAYTHVLWGPTPILADAFAFVPSLTTLAGGEVGVQTVRHNITLLNTDIALTAVVDVVVQGVNEVSGELRSPVFNRVR